MSVSGIDKFKNAMQGFESSYVLIGGSACSLLMAEYGAEFRATKDLDIVILSDRPDDGFAKALWTFVKEGNYEPWARSDSNICFYRFVKPRKTGYPSMLELFARHPEFPLSNKQSEITPLPFKEDISSLSAILLDDDYYAFLLDGLSSIDGISVLDAAHLIPLKMRAHIDLNNRRNADQHVNSADLKKHRKDAIRLLEIIPDDTALALPAKIKADAKQFIGTIEDTDFRIDQLKVGFNRQQAAKRLKELCGV